MLLLAVSSTCVIVLRWLAKATSDLPADGTVLLTVAGMQDLVCLLCLLPAAEPVHRQLIEGK